MIIAVFAGILTRVKPNLTTKTQRSCQHAPCSLLYREWAIAL